MGDNVKLAVLYKRFTCRTSIPARVNEALEKLKINVRCCDVNLELRHFNLRAAFDFISDL